MILLQRIKRIILSQFTDTSQSNDTLFRLEYERALQSLNNIQNNFIMQDMFQSHYLLLKQDYHNLEAQANMSNEELKQQYKHLLNKYHPDKFIDQPEKAQIAHEIIITLNKSFQKIMKTRSRYGSKPKTS